MSSKLLVLVIAAGTLALAQGYRNSQPANAPRNGSGLDLAKVQTIEGAVTAVNVSYGSQYPSIQINQTTVRLAPVWFLLENGFEIQAGDKLKVTAAPSLQYGILTAIRLQNTGSGAQINLRDDAGLPLWTQTGGQQGGQQTMGGRTACAGFTPIETAGGVVEQVTAGLGIQMPSVVLKTAGGVLTIKVGPERILEAADFEIKAGDTLTVRYALCATGEMVALDLTNAAGEKIILRNDDGSIAWR